MKRYIRSSSIQAADAADNGVDDLIDNLDEDFDYVISGIEALNRSGGDGAKSAMSIASELRVTLADYINRVANTITKE